MLGITTLSIVGTVSARLKQVVDLGGCSEGSPCKHTAAYYDDDCTNDRFVIYTYCNCHTRIMDYSIQPKSPTPTLPWNFLWLIDHADWSTPGAPNGVYLIDSDGTQIPMLNAYPGEHPETCLS
jgi:hypothetical protein